MEDHFTDQIKLSKNIRKKHNYINNFKKIEKFIKRNSRIRKFKEFIKTNNSRY